MGSFSGVPAPSTTNIYAELVRSRIDSPFESAEDRCRDARRMPVHAQYPT